MESLEILQKKLQESRKTLQDDMNKRVESETIKNCLSFLTIYRAEDLEYSEGYLAHVPEGTEVVMVQTVKDSQNGLTDIKETILYGGRILKTAIYHYQNFSFSEALNSAKELCTREWICKLDIDERISFEPAEIKFLEKNVVKTVGAIQIPLHNYTAPTKDIKYAVCGTAQLARLFRNLPEFEYTHSVHEQIVESVIRNGYNVVVMSSVSPLIRHLGYKGDNPKKMAQKFLRNLHLLCRDILETPETDVRTLNWLYQYALKTLESMELGGMIKRLDEHGNIQK